MKLFYNKNSKDPIYYTQIGILNGKSKKVTTRNVKRFGKHSELLKITDFNERVERANDAASSSTALNIGYFFLQNLMGDLRLRDFFKEKTVGKKMTFDSYTIHRFLIYSRIMESLSKYATLGKLDSYYEKLDFDYQHILRFTDFQEEHYDDYWAWLYQQSDTIVKRKPSVLYYDCTNFYFECEQADGEIADEVTGEVITSA